MTTATTARPGPQDALLITPRGAAWGAFAAALVVAGLAVLIVRSWAPLLDVDRSVGTAIHDWALRTPWAVDVSRVLETIGRFRFAMWVVVATTVVLLLTRRWWAALTLVVLAAVAPLVTDLLKLIVGRARPVWAVPLGSEDTLSYPSGHATAGIAVYAACAVAIGSLLRSPTWGAVVALTGILLGIAIGLSRLVLGVHWPSDVVGGWGVALAVAGAAGALFVLPRPPARRPPEGFH